MSPEQFYRAVLDLNKERDVPRLLDTALAKRATGAAAAQIELGPVRRSDGASWTCADMLEPNMGFCVWGVCR